MNQGNPEPTINAGAVSSGTQPPKHHYVCLNELCPYEADSPKQINMSVSLVDYYMLPTDAKNILDHYQVGHRVVER